MPFSGFTMAGDRPKCAVGILRTKVRIFGYM